jgi:AdoMet-dependent heme synthase
VHRRLFARSCVLSLAQPAYEALARLPAQPFHALDTLWIQVAGTVCNLSCVHCFVTCGPQERRHEPMTRAQVAARVAEALELGAREIYFTGGEPFVVPGFDDMIEDTLALAPVTVLTHGTLFTSRRIERLAALARASRYSLELRVSLDGLDAPSHDAFRGEGTFARTLEGLRALSEAGLLPIVTVTRFSDEDPLAFRQRCFAMLREGGVREPRLKVLPLFRLGREAGRSRAYRPGESLARLLTEAFDPHRLQCGSCRAVTSQGVFVCPLLVDEPGGRMGGTLAESARPFPLAHGACHTCWVTGMTCANG